MGRSVVIGKPPRYKPSSWIVIRDENVLKHLLEKGAVYWVVGLNRRTGFARLKTSRDGEEIAIVSVTFVGPILRRNGDFSVRVNGSIKSLRDYVTNSGYLDYDSWRKAILRKRFSYPRLYRIELLQTISHRTPSQ